MTENSEEDSYIVIVIGSVLPVFMHLQQRQCTFIPYPSAEETGMSIQQTLSLCRETNRGQHMLGQCHSHLV